MVVINKQIMDKQYSTKDFERDIAISLGYRYLKGDEEYGIFIDYDKAAYFFELAGWKEDTTERLNPNSDLFTANYYLNGHSKTTNAIKEMIEDLTIRFGTPDNEEGRFVPIEVLMQIFVGSPYYHGNLLKMQDIDNGGLLLHVETETIKPLLYAMRLVFTDMQIEMKQIV